MLIKMKSITKIKIILFVILVAGVKATHAQTNLSNLSQEREIKTSISYCNFEIPKALKSANITFSIYYMFKVDENGEVINIEKKRDNYIGEEKVKSCISNWKVVGVPGSTWFGVNFFWSRNKGWFRQTIQSYKLNFSQIMEMEGIGIDQSKKSTFKSTP
jgi:hypothetical protein